MKQTSPAVAIPVLRVKPGDTLVIHVSVPMSEPAREAIAEEAKKYVPEGVKCWVMRHDTHLEVISPAGDEDTKETEAVAD